MARYADLLPPGAAAYSPGTHRDRECMVRYAALKAPVLAFFSADLYRDVAARWRARSFGYLVALLAVCWIPSTFTMQRGWTTFVDGKSASLVDQIPPITITQGVVTVDAKEPVYITDPD